MTTQPHVSSQHRHAHITRSAHAARWVALSLALTAAACGEPEKPPFVSVPPADSGASDASDAGGTGGASGTGGEAGTAGTGGDGGTGGDAGTGGTGGDAGTGGTGGDAGIGGTGGDAGTGGTAGLTGSVVDGDYDGSTMSCATQSTPMVHTSTSAAATIMDFRNISITARRTGTQWVETYEDSDCVLTLTRTIDAEVVDTQPFINFSPTRTYTWTPSNCTLTARAGSDSAEIGSSFPAYQPLGIDEAHVDDAWFYSIENNAFRFSAVAVWSAIDPPLELPCQGGGTEGFVRTWTPR